MRLPASARSCASAPRRRAPGSARSVSSSLRLMPPDEGVLEEAIGALRDGVDPERGGFGGAPKFPPASALELLLARGELEMAETTFDAMLAGGIYDQLGGGFPAIGRRRLARSPTSRRCSTTTPCSPAPTCTATRRWATSATVASARRRSTGSCARCARPEGGFYSALDADTEGEEGRFYVWTPAQIDELLGPDAQAVIDFYGVSEGGNFEGANVLHLAGGGGADQPPALGEARRALYAARSGRVWPSLDDKRLSAWNALAIAALAEAGAVLGREDYLEAARRCAEFVLGSLRDSNGRLLRSFNDGRAHLGAYLEDHAFLLEALLALYEATFERRWFEQAHALAETTIERFGDPERGGFFSTADDHEALIARRKEIGDHPIPSGNSSAAMGLLQAGRTDWRAAL